MSSSNNFDIYNKLTNEITLLGLTLNIDQVNNSIYSKGTLDSWINGSQFAQF